MYVRVTRYRVRHDSVDDVVELIRSGWLPLIQQSNGFRGFEAVAVNIDNGYAPESDQILTIMRHDTREQCLDALETARSWIFENLGHVLVRPSENVMGELLLDEYCDEAG